MRIKVAQLAVTAYAAKQIPEPGLPEIAMVGRSNVGKSSLINRLVNRKNLARTSSSPGKTRSINFFAIDEAWVLVDLPGYGYARASKSERAAWGGLIEAYLIQREPLLGVVHLVDIRHDPMASDHEMQKWLQFHGIPCQIVATKADKLSRNRRMAAVQKMRTLLHADRPIIACSSETGEGMDDLLNALGRWLEPPQSDE